MHRSLLALALGLTIVASAQGAGLPARPSEAEHPGSAVYPYRLQREVFEVNNRQVDVFLPAEGRGRRLPVIVFGHGQATPVEGYDATLEHLARKGAVVIHPQFDTGFFDQDWRRMASDFNSLTGAALQRYVDWVNPEQVVYAGHSKGAYIALMAAGAPRAANGPVARAVVLFAPAGYDAEYLGRMDPAVPLTIIWGQADSVIKRGPLEEIYRRSPATHKQFIEARSYNSTQPTLAADHFFVLNKSFFFGGRNGVSPFHYHAAWKWLLGAARDLEAGGRRVDPYLYGDEAATSGLAEHRHLITRSW